MSSAFADTTTLSATQSSRRGSETPWLIEDNEKNEAESDWEPIIIDRVVFKSRVQTYIDRHAKINLIGIGISLITMLLLILFGVTWAIFFVMPFFLGFLEMYITVMVDRNSRKG